DGSDNFPTRFLLADACFLQKRPLLHGSIYQFEAQIALFVPDSGPCYRCLFKEPPKKDAIPNCNEAGVLGVLPGTVGLMMATEAIKFLTNLGNPIVGKLLIYNALDQSLRHLQISKDLDCSLCGPSPTILSVQDIDLTCETKFPDEVFPTEAKKLLDEGAYLLDVREPYEFELGHIKGAELIPVGKISDSTTSFLPKDKPILVYCHHGIRSQYAIKTLQQLGFSNAVHLAGGIDAWSTQVDPQIPRY
ncbi:MAG TPA: rhodanese-like domain-containing protein, partial [Bdellovibrionota bacterium]|nr:rhodanese-like domain-containing protein [Bdellovibrionota bacterium]